MTEGPRSDVTGHDPARGEPAPVTLTVLRVVAGGAARLVWWWPGVVVAVAVYVAVALAVYRDAYPNLWGGLAAALTAAAWYRSPLRGLEARRRERLRPRSS